MDFNLLDFGMPIYWISLAMALIATVIPSFLMAEGIRVIGSSNAAIIGSVGPISTIGMAYLFLDERLGWLQWVGTFFCNRRNTFDYFAEERGTSVGNFEY